MGRRGPWLATIIGLALAASAAPAGAAQTTFHPRLHGRLGLVPALGHNGHTPRVDPATGVLTPVVYHGGSVMVGGVTAHTIFWAPPGYAFQGSPGGGAPTYKQLIQQYYTDVAHDSGATGTCTPVQCNELTVLPQFAQGTTPGAIAPGAYQLTYSASADSIDDTDPYPAKASQCASPAGTATCITDNQVTAEIDHVIQSTPGATRGLHDLWYVFLPPGVDECISAGACGTNVFGGYHGSFDLGHGLTVYALTPDPIIEDTAPPGADPQGNPDAERSVDVVAHETVEAMTDPKGTGWMDPNGFEVGDKCETGPQLGPQLGYAANGSPYNQVVNTHQYLLQAMWANQDAANGPGCVQATTTTTSQLPLPQVNLVQFSPAVSGNVNVSSGGGIGVQVSLVRANPNGDPVVVARSSTTTAADGSWSLSLAPHAVGDDRDEIDVDYSGAGAPSPNHQVILTGNGGNPVNAAGWTGWTWLDAGSNATSAAGGSTLSLAPCSQTGVLSYTYNGITGTQSPTDVCNVSTAVATVSTPPIGPKDVVTASSNDNRAFAAPDAPIPNLLGGLVRLTVPVGEANSASQFNTPLAPGFNPTGLPMCSADLLLGAVQCVGLVPQATYQLSDGAKHVSGSADGTGTLIAPLAVRRGDSVVLSNGARTLTTLHLAQLRAFIAGLQTVLAGGNCQPGSYYGPGLTTLTPGTSAGSPTNLLTGGVALTGQVCPLDGDATGLSSTSISQTDDLSGGQTITEVPQVLDTSPIDGETVYGTFTALAESGLPVPGNDVLPTDDIARVSLQILTDHGAPVFKAANVNRGQGVAVPALKPGNYIAIWKLIDVNGDRRVVGTRFIQQVGRTGPGPRAVVHCRRSGAGRIPCTVSFPGRPNLRGQLKLRLVRGGNVVALGHGRVVGGRAQIGLRVLHQVSRGAWRATLVLARAHLQPVTIHVAVGSVA